MWRRFLLPGLTIMLAACGDGALVGSDAAVEAVPTSPPVAATSAAVPAPPAEARSEKEANELYEFEYSYPAAAAAIPGLKALLDRRLTESRSELAAEAQKAKKEAKADGYPYRTYAAATTWSVVADTPRFLSLSAQVYTYSGGAHGMTVFDTILWDKQAGKMVLPSEIFTSNAALRDAIRQPFCKALDVQRAKKREGLDWSADDIFGECIDPTEHTIILGSSNGQVLDRIGVLVEPYAAGPYAEGSYDVTVPVTGKVMATVKPQYRSALALGS